MTFANTPAKDAIRKPAPDGRTFSPKIHPWHIDRLAIVYVRQSTPQQVAENRESTDRQYALVNRAIELGWSPERILVVDQDQGKSGATEPRAVFITPCFSGSWRSAQKSLPQAHPIFPVFLAAFRRKASKIAIFTPLPACMGDLSRCKI